MRTRTWVPGGQSWDVSACCSESAASTAAPAVANAKKNSSPRESTSKPPHLATASRTRRRWSPRTAAYASPSWWTSWVDPSTSVKRSVTVPCGSSLIPAYFDRNLGSDASALARRALDDEGAVEGGEAVGQSSQAGAPRRVGSADPVVGDLDERVAVQLGDVDAHSPRF